MHTWTLTPALTPRNPITEPKGPNEIRRDLTLRCNTMNDMSTTARLASYLDPSGEQTARWLTTPCRLSAWTAGILIHQSGLLRPAGQNQMSVAPPPINSGSDSRTFGGPWSSDERGRSRLINTAGHARGANSVHSASIARAPTSLPPKQTIICVPAPVRDVFASMSEKVCEVKVTNVGL